MQGGRTCGRAVTEVVVRRRRPVCVRGAGAAGRKPGHVADRQVVDLAEVASGIEVSDAIERKRGDTYRPIEGSIAGRQRGNPGRIRRAADARQSRQMRPALSTDFGECTSGVHDRCFVDGDRVHRAIRRRVPVRVDRATAIARHLRHLGSGWAAGYEKEITGHVDIAGCIHRKRGDGTCHQRKPLRIAITGTLARNFRKAVSLGLTADRHEVSPDIDIAPRAERKRVDADAKKAAAWRGIPIRIRCANTIACKLREEIS